MCGILAIHLRKQEQDLNRIFNGWNMLTNRGPDDGTFSVTGNLILGFKRLAIVDTSPAGNQPFEYSGARVICNGEIYNHKCLEETWDICCKSNSDCECLSKLFFKLSWPELVGKLNGDFAIILYYQNKIYFARDRVGVRPLFMGFTEAGNIAWASYARVLTSFGCTKVQQIQPGWGEYDMISTRLEMNLYKLPLTHIGVGDTERAIRETLIKSVRDRLMSDRPVACLLSGGLDSSLITSIVCHLVGAANVRTYSVGMEGSEDLKYARRVADYLGTVHTEALFTPEEGFAAIPEVIRDLESYDITTVRASVGMWLMAYYISHNRDDIVLLSGEGADELFCGYLYFHYAPGVEELEAESRRLLKELPKYDVLRADRCVSSHGLELRVPFLDRRMIDICLSTSGDEKGPQGGWEKHLLRSAFSVSPGGRPWLPEDILWRRKDGMSDGVSGNGGKKWYEQIQDFVEEKVSDEEFEPHKDDFPFKEAYYYKKIFDDIFPTWEGKYEYWLPKWVDHGGDPSGRNLQIFQKEEKEEKE